ncbi:MAG TPA: S1/P1 nuclease [Candidatus Binataceae bacterium]
MFALLLTLATQAPAWYPEGHEVIAIIAADNLTPRASSEVAHILGVTDNKRAVADAMAAASILPDTEFRKDPSTHSWHYVALCLQDRPSDLPARCPGGNCVTAKIDEYARRLKDHDYDKGGAAGDLAFLIHFVGDVHQPLHAAGNSDRGGTCQPVEVTPPEANLHFAWDDAVVVVLEHQLGTHSPRATATALARIHPQSAMSAGPVSAGQMAWESHELARTDVYGALHIARQPCSPSACHSATPGKVVLSDAYMKREANVAGTRLALAGYRLARILDEIWP